MNYRIALSLTFVHIPAFVGCAAEIEAPVAAEAKKEIFCGSQESGAAKDVSHTSVEVYYPEAIHAALNAHPELAELTGITEPVTSCSDARLFARAYQDYEDEGPLFDEAEMMDGAVDAPTEPRPVKQTTIDKVHQGTSVNGAGATGASQGIVQIHVSNKSCSGFFITGQHLITSAHCIASTATQNIYLNAPGLPTAFVSAKPTIHPNYTGEGNRSNDIAVIRLDSPFAWATTERRFRLFTGSTKTERQLQIYGYGANAYDGTGGGTLRVGRNRTPINLNFHQDGYFRAYAHTARACRGDSGGPAIRETTGTPIVWGVAHGFKGDQSKACPMSDDWMFWTKTNTNIAFVESQVGTCSRFTDADGQYARCF